MIDVRDHGGVFAGTAKSASRVSATATTHGVVGIDEDGTEYRWQISGSNRYVHIYDSDGIFKGTKTLTNNITVVAAGKWGYASATVTSNVLTIKLFDYNNTMLATSAGIPAGSGYNHQTYGIQGNVIFYTNRATLYLYTFDGTLISSVPWGFGDGNVYLVPGYDVLILAATNTFGNPTSMYVIDYTNFDASVTNRLNTIAGIQNLMALAAYKTRVN
ncbi:hypothetical protein JNUCC23_08895 [Peribacillus sp. JNUCC 23]